MNRRLKQDLHAITRERSKVEGNDVNAGLKGDWEIGLSGIQISPRTPIHSIHSSPYIP
jgi:hypothetical protein